MISQENVYKIGILGKPHGIKGELSFMFNDDVFDRVDADYLIILIDGILVPFYIEEYRFHGNDTALVKFYDIDDSDRARDLTGCEVYFPKALSDVDEFDNSWESIVGFDVFNGDNYIGAISSVDTSTENILLSVSTNDGNEILIPAAEEFMKNIDADKNKIVMELPDGLLDV
ncbi:MAG TPA: ribosome maturation factor RimM [Xylanibacter oryzae]|nr:ribosome maturation factor RimM [Xylanibacter oryzae]